MYQRGAGVQIWKGAGTQAFEKNLLTKALESSKNHDNRCIFKKWSLIVHNWCPPKQHDRNIRGLRRGFIEVGRQRARWKTVIPGCIHFHWPFSYVSSAWRYMSKKMPLQNQVQRPRKASGKQGPQDISSLSSCPELFQLWSNMMFKSLFSRVLKPPTNGDGTTFLSHDHAVSLSSGEVALLSSLFFLIWYIL